MLKCKFLKFFNIYVNPMPRATPNVEAIAGQVTLLPLSVDWFFSLE